MKLNIIHTNDIHSHFENFARVTSLIKHYSDDQTLILDGGDFADFKSIELQGTKGLAAVRMLETAGYEALTIGNNELFNGTETLEYMAVNSSVPFISCNLLKSNGDLFEGVKSSIILHKNGLRILLTGASPDLQEFNELMGFQINDYKEAIQKEITKHQNQYDICIVLNHIGTEVDIELAEAIDEIDLILSAHDHVLYEEAKVVNGTILNSAGMYGEHVGIVEMEYNNGSLELLASSTIPTSKAMENEEIKGILASSKEEAIAHLSKPLYSVATPLWHDVIEENPITNLIADGLKDRFRCEIGIINSGIVNGGLVDFVSNKKLIEICPSPLNPTYFEIQGKHLKNALESSLDSSVCMADGRGPGFRGKYAGRLHVSGIEVFHNGTSITSLTVNGEVFEPERWYKVASSDYLLRGSGYPDLAHNRNFSYQPDEIKDVIREYAKQDLYVKTAFKNRWFSKNLVASKNLM
ncbi:bifunctional metallophosphatase/5'-nucleotidase [Guptibacillus hwajinpoensis]|uniref:2',3'-cyclic-nucleotide 2'-phosphodiesterase (5'-nucleotidase family) n=1 Tax=Guptibacillus hwajinpoensis TaxID=208199 RepID=A0ABU0K1H1_9BACL|nr:5'-nucleotidase C-terminal domain-containing protein [Alkalihalobacillus hemicentroti]MDQ0483193.1 2',3'-cyclic-nucleotide 2'-phosphodiesterase (5'-nucleotidase family) [Alkalihalobacillus hemicentroti]